MTLEYRFAPPGPRDEPITVAECTWCGREIYAGDEVTHINNYGRVHRECEYGVIEALIVRERGVIGADGTIE
ncbi:hypothetical protein D3C74_402250 [compost metagenome]